MAGRAGTAGTGRRALAAVVAAAALAAALPLQGGPAAAQEVGEPSAAPVPACLVPLPQGADGVDTTVRSGTDLPVAVPAGLPADARSVLVEAVATEASAVGDLVLVGPEGVPPVPLLRTVPGAPSSATGSVPGAAVALRLSAGSARVRVRVTAYVPDQDCFTPLPQRPVLDTATGTGLPAAGALPDGSSTVVDLAGAAGLPVDAGATVYAVRAAAASGSPRVVVSEDDADPVVLLDRAVPEGGVVDGTVVLPPSGGTRYRVHVTGGSVALAVSAAGAFASSNAYAPTDAVLLDGEAGEAVVRGRRVTVPLPEEVAQAASVTLAVTASTPAGLLEVDTSALPLDPPAGLVAQDVPVHVWPEGAARPAAPSFVVPAGGRLEQLLVRAPGATGRLHVEAAAGAVRLGLRLVGSSAPPPPPNQVLDEVTHVAEADDVAEVVQDPETREATLRYTGPDSLDVGDVLALGVTEQTPDGFLGLVTDVVPAAPGEAGPLLRTRQASLLDALPSADFTRLDDVASDPVEEPADEPLPGAEEPPPSDGSPVPPPDEDPAALPGLPTPVAPAAAARGALPKAPPISCSGRAAGLSHSLALRSQVSLTGSWRPWQPPVVDFAVDGGVAGSLAVGLGGSATCSARVVVPGPRLPTLSFTVGPVPVVVVPSLSLTAQLTGRVEGALTGRVAVDVGTRAGVRYADRRFSPYVQPRNAVTARLDARAGGSLTASLLPRLDLKVYGAAGPFVEVGPSGSLDVDLLGSPWWRTSASVRARVGLKTDLWFVKAEFTTDLLDLLRRPAGSAPSGYPGPQIATTSLPGGQVGAAYAATLTPAGGRGPFRWYLTAGRLPSGLALARDGRISGRPTADEATGFYVRVLDAAGYSSPRDRYLTVSVGAAPPPPPPPPPPSDPPPPPPPGDSRVVSLAKGASAVGRPGCSSSACRYMQVTLSGFPAGRSVSITCADQAGGFFTYRRTTDGAGRSTSAVCYYGFPGGRAYVVADGKVSNTVVW